MASCTGGTVSSFWDLSLFKDSYMNCCITMHLCPACNCPKQRIPESVFSWSCYVCPMRAQGLLNVAKLAAACES